MRTTSSRILTLALVTAAACDSTTTSTDDASLPGSDASVNPAPDATTPAYDGGSLDGGFVYDASLSSDSGVTNDGSVAADASVSGDAGPNVSDASSTTADSAVATGPGICGGTTPHGCWKPKAGNDVNCPPQIHEQSALYPPAAEWVACSSPYYQACIYLRPDGSEANCSCDLGLHWLCSY